MAKGGEGGSTTTLMLSCFEAWESAAITSSYIFVLRESLRQCCFYRVGKKRELCTSWLKAFLRCGRFNMTTKTPSRVAVSRVEKLASADIASVSVGRIELCRGPFWGWMVVESESLEDCVREEQTNGRIKGEYYNISNGKMFLILLFLN